MNLWCWLGLVGVVLWGLVGVFLISGVLKVNGVVWFWKIGGVMYEWGAEMGGKGFVMVGVLLLVFSLVMVFGVDYVDKYCGVSMFSWMIVVFVVGVMVLLMSSSLYSLLIGWEFLGVVSFLLIGYYCSRIAWGSALITMLINRLGDVAMVLLFFLLVSFSGVVESNWFMIGVMVSVCVSFCVVTKSAQIPFGGWLPLAMAAPTPVSALVHSSTLVIAGLFVGWYLSELFEDKILVYLLVLGVATIVAAGVSVLFEQDFKKVVAYSTSMHLGLMLLMGVCMCWGMMGFHMQLHAFFKSLLFVMVGYVIIMVFHDQDFRGLAMGASAGGEVGVMLLSSLCSLIGLSFFSGWVTKDLFLEFLETGLVGVVNWILSMLFLSASGVYSVKLLIMLFLEGMGVGAIKVVGLSYCLKSSLFFMFVCLVSSALGIGVLIWVVYGCLINLVGLSTKLMYFIFMLLLGIWFSFSGLVGTGFSCYLQGVFQVNLVKLWYEFGSVMMVLEDVWLGSVIVGLVSVVNWVNDIFSGFLINCDWYLIVGFVVMGVLLSFS